MMMAVCSACGSTTGAAQRLSSCDLETIPREFLVAMADTAEREDRIEALERENVTLRLRLAANDND